MYGFFKIFNFESNTNANILNMQTVENTKDLNSIYENFEANEEINVTNEFYMCIENSTDIKNTIEILNTEEKNIWCLEIPKIGLFAEIDEGTDSETLNKYIGHFEETPKENGNVGLAAHNRGYDVNYFSKLKELEINDQIFYTYKNIRKEYKVISKDIISYTNWDVLKNSKLNMLTLITCVENQPQYRYCIKAIEI